MASIIGFNELTKLGSMLANATFQPFLIYALVAAGFDRPTVLRVWKLLDRAEYKRRQAPPGVKITARAFGRDRRYPITNGFTALVR